MKPHPILAAVREIWIMEETESLDCKIMAEFAAMHDLLVSIDTGTIEPIIAGSNGFIYCYAEIPARLSVAWSPDNLSSDQWTGTIRKMLRLGFSIVRDCVSESYACWTEPADANQASLAIALAGIKPVSDAAAINAKVCEVIRAARARKAKALEHSRTMRELEVIRKHCDMEDYCPDFVPIEYHLHL
jgi:hypothetical protein